MAHADGLPAAAGNALRPGTLRGTPGFFRAGQDASGAWSLLTPAGAPFFAKCVHGVRAAPLQGDGALPRDSAALLRSWGFNAVGLTETGAGRDDGLPFLASVDFCFGATLIAAPGARLPDVFDAAWPARAADRAREVCAPLADQRGLIGWVTDAAAEWPVPSAAGRPSLLQICLSLEPSFAAYHAAWEFVLALHGGRLEALAQAWNASLPNKEVVRELTRAEEGLGTRGYLRDDARWTREFARRYFTTSAAAIRAADPNHLVLGCRFRHAVGAHVLAECVYPAVDVAMPDWTELPSSTEPATQPLLAGEVSWVGGDFLRGAASGRIRRLTTVERMLHRARLALERVGRHPAVVGYAWSRWQDEPGEQPPFARGLMHTNGAEAREHTELLAQFNARVEQVRGRAAH
jgi:agarase